jgi:hypothetical protein
MPYVEQAQKPKAFAKENPTYQPIPYSSSRLPDQADLEVFPLKGYLPVVLYAQ